MYDNNDDDEEEDIGGRCGVMVVSLCDEKAIIILKYCI